MEKKESKKENLNTMNESKCANKSRAIGQLMPITVYMYLALENLLGDV